MSSEHSDRFLDEQLQRFAVTLEAETVEPIRPAPQRLSSGAHLDDGVDVAAIGNLTLAPSRTTRRRRFLPAVACVATIIVVVGGLVALTGTPRSPDNPAPVQSVVPSPATSGAPGSTVVGETADPDSPIAPESTLAPIPTTGTPGSEASTTVPAPADSWSGGLLADIDAEQFLPLDSVSEGDFVVPTLPIDWRIISGGFATNPAGISNSAVTIIEARPDGTTGPSIEVRVFRLGICVELDLVSCETSDESTEISGVEWRPFVELNGVRATIGDLLVDVLVDASALQGAVLDDPVIVTYLEGLRVGTGDDAWEALRTDVGEACWTCSDQEDTAESSRQNANRGDSSPADEDPPSSTGEET